MQNNGFERTMGTHRLGVNGLRFCEFRQINSLVTRGILFFHKSTWASADGRVGNQIDHLFVSDQWRSSVLDAKVQRGADETSDNYLVRTRGQTSNYPSIHTKDETN